MTDRDTIKDAVEAFKLAVDAEAENRAAARSDIEFARLGGDYQWTLNGVNWAEKRRGRPCLTINMLPKFQRQVMNDIRQNRPAIKVRPVDGGADVKTAEVYTGLIRNIEQQSHADTAWDTASEHAIAGGVGYAKIDVQFAYDDTFAQDIVLERVANPFTIYGDPYSQGADSADWNSAFEVELVSEAQFKRRFKGHDAVSFEDPDYHTLEAPWREGDQVLIAKWWRREEVTRKLLKLSDGRVVAAEDFDKANPETGISERVVAEIMGIHVVGERGAPSYRVTRTILSGVEALNDKEGRAWPGRYIPIIPVYGEDVNIDGKRVLKSLIRDARDPQMQLNFWRSYAAEAVALSPKVPFVGPVGSFETDPNWATANADNHPFLEYDPVAGGAPPQRQGYVGMDAGAMRQAMQANDDIKATLGIFDASIGAKSNETSGKAIMARQREGDVATFHFADNLNRAIRHAGCIIIDLIPKVYSGERVIRILGEDGQAQNVQLGPRQAQAPMQAPQVDQAQPGQEAPTPPQVFDLTAGKYDLVVQAGPSFTTRREETADALTKITQAAPQFAGILGPLLLKTLDVPGIEEISKKLEAAQAQSQQDPAQAEIAKARAQAAAEAEKLKSQHVLAQQKQQNDAALARQKAEADHALAREQAQWDYELERMKCMDQMRIADDKAQHDQRIATAKNDQAIALANDKHAKTPSPDRDIATMLAQAVERGLSRAEIKVTLPRMKRTALRDENGFIQASVDEPIPDEPPPVMN